MKPSDASQRVRLPPGKGAAHSSPGAQSGAFAGIRRASTCTSSSIGSPTASSAVARSPVFASSTSTSSSRLSVNTTARSRARLIST